MTNDFNLLFNRVGLSPFVFQDVPTYRRLTLEFLSTLTHTVNAYAPWDGMQGTERVRFRLMNRGYDISLTEWCNHFGFDNNDTYARCSNYLLSPSPIEHFCNMSIYAPVPKGGDIECPAV
jgi:hypothetical protein